MSIADKLKGTAVVFPNFGDFDVSTREKQEI